VGFQEPPTGALPASFVISDCMVSKGTPPLTVGIRANGQLAGEWTLGPGREVQRRSITLPAEAVADRLELVLTFHISNPRSPASLGWNSDSRPLGMRLARAVIGRGDIEIPALGKRTVAPRSMVKRIIGLPGFALHVARLLARKWTER
jgi:hypothetical protein